MMDILGFEGQTRVRIRPTRPTQPPPSPPRRTLLNNLSFEDQASRCPSDAINVSDSNADFMNKDSWNDFGMNQSVCLAPLSKGVQENRPVTIKPTRRPPKPPIRNDSIRSLPSDGLSLIPRKRPRESLVLDPVLSSELSSNYKSVTLKPIRRAPKPPFSEDKSDAVEEVGRPPSPLTSEDLVYAIAKEKLNVVVRRAPKPPEDKSDAVEEVGRPPSPLATEDLVYATARAKSDVLVRRAPKSPFSEDKSDAVEEVGRTPSSLATEELVYAIAKEKSNMVVRRAPNPPFNEDIHKSDAVEEVGRLPSPLATEDLVYAIARAKSDVVVRRAPKPPVGRDPLFPVPVRRPPSEPPARIDPTLFQHGSNPFDPAPESYEKDPLTEKYQVSSFEQRFMGRFHTCKSFPCPDDISEYSVRPNKTYPSHGTRRPTLKQIPEFTSHQDQPCCTSTLRRAPKIPGKTRIPDHI